MIGWCFICLYQPEGAASIQHFASLFTIAGISLKNPASVPWCQCVEASKLWAESLLVCGTDLLPLLMRG